MESGTARLSDNMPAELQKPILAGSVAGLDRGLGMARRVPELDQQETYGSILVAVLVRLDLLRGSNRTNRRTGSRS